MPPKKNKGKKRGATEDEEEKEIEEQDVTKTNESTELLSPSEVVKMRKKARPTTSAPQPNTDSKPEKQRTKTNKNSEKDKSTDKKTKMKDNERKEKSKSRKDGIDDKKSRNYRERRRPASKKKPSHSEESDEGSTADIMYPCGICMKEVSDADEAILCEAGCEFWYHRNCTGMTDIAYQFLTNEENCEWVCDKCIATKAVPLVKVKMQTV